MRLMDVSVIGLGKLGLPLLATLASRGLRVLGHDHSAERLDAIPAGRLPREPRLGDMLRQHAPRIELTRDLTRVRDTALSFVVVPTPSTRDGRFSLRYAETALSDLGAVLRGQRRHHVVVVVSTVLPGDMARLTVILERTSNRRCGEDLGLCYNPAFIALGNVVQGFLQPDFVLIGESDVGAGDRLESVHRRLSVAPIRRMSLINAEIAKIALNTFVTAKISFGNTLARLCERLPGGDVDAVTSAIGLDRRIGPTGLRGGLGFGGPCFPRDNRAFSAVARAAGIRARLADASDRVNRDQLLHLHELVRSLVPRRGTIAILGVAYKPDTDVIEASQSVDLAQVLVAEQRRVVLADPMALDNARALFGDDVEYAASADLAVAAADLVVLATPWPGFAEISDRSLRAGGQRRVLIDCWRQLVARRLPKNVEYLPLGRSSSMSRPSAGDAPKRKQMRRA